MSGQPERALLPIATSAQSRAVVLSMLGAQRRLAALAAIALVGATILALSAPPILGAITDAVLEDRGAGRVDTFAGLLIVVLLAQAVLAGWAAALVARLGEHALATLREEVLDRAVSVSLADIERAGTGDLIARVGDDVDAVSEATRSAIPELITSILSIGLTVVGLALIDWRLALAGFAATPVHVLATRWYLRRSGPLYAAERVANSRRAQQLNETVAGAETVRAFRLGKAHRELVATASQGAVDRSLRASRAGSRFFAFLNGAEAIGLASTLSVGYAAVRADLVSVGEATAAALYFHGLFGPIGGLLGLLDVAQDAGASLNRLVGVTRLRTPAEPTSAAAPADASVRLHEISFAYTAGHPVLEGVDLEVAPGEQVALVGTSGAGKTTIAKLIAGIHTADSGDVSIGGASHAELGPIATREAVALVTQEVHVFAGTVAADLRLARPGATDEELHHALLAVGADGWANTLPDGLLTIVGHGGHQLTTTQAQQLALARVVLTDSPIVVLDEATAEAGSSGARMLERSARAATQGRTALIVAHRLTQAAAADRVVVVQSGRIVERGTHDELIEQDGRYAALWDAWSEHRPRIAE